MNEHDDAHLDAALEAIARQEPPPDHVARILARTGPARDRTAGWVRPRWVLPVAASVLVALAATWQVNRQLESALDAEMTGADRGSTFAESRTWGALQEIDRPVLPPQAYWGMDAFAEFATLRPGTTAGTQERRSTGIRRADGTLAWVPEPTGLPPIEMESIVPAPLVVATVAPLEDIALADIPLVPIVIDPIAVEENP